MESGLRLVTKECNQSVVYYVSQQGRRTLRALPHMSFHSVTVCVMHECFDFGVCVCVCLRERVCSDECASIPCIRYMSVLHACMLLNVFQ